MDNAANNTASMKKLSDMLWQECEIKFNPIEHQIPCFPHILNICVNHILHAYMNTDFTDVPSTWTNALGEVMRKEDYVEAITWDPILICQNIIRVIHASGQWWKAFHDMIVISNANQWFTEDPTEVPTMELLCNVKTWWDSAYFMINHMRALHLAIDHFLSLPRGSNDELSGLCLTVLEWEVLQDLEVVLEWRALVKHTPHCGAIINARLDWAKQYYQQMGHMTAYCIAMFVDPTIRLTWVDRHWGPKASDIQNLVLHTMTEYCSHLPVRQVGTQPMEPAQATHPQPFQTLATRYGLPLTELNQALQAPSSVEQEFNAYISAPLSPNRTDPLAFWEASKSLYPVVFTIALNYLPIQVSSVPSKHVFSSSSETDMKKCNHIMPALMEALQMLKFSLKKECLDFTRGWITPERDMLFASGGGKSLDDILGMVAQEEGDDIADGMPMLFT
ncbi:hypothetical protein PISMIDRAFT_9698 [Pisolithus microcarpus 441]|uniref:HAT C-terminal dimerisation domain-containing protein n=1 Tax=Pisolithus microcarpus 441 TaxID=765257 RepID=A0A0C9Z7L2_9AGAM|nr:hypothetical protein PISMIDRAFT_9698 [Pisolithus microcarpus 441]